MLALHRTANSNPLLPVGLAALLFGGSAPFVGQYLVLATDNELAPAFY